MGLSVGVVVIPNTLLQISPAGRIVLLLSILYFNCNLNPIAYMNGNVGRDYEHFEVQNSSYLQYLPIKRNCTYFEALS